MTMEDRSITSEQLTDHRGLYLDIVLDHFRGKAEWPILQDVQRELAKRTGKHVALLTVLQSFPPEAQPISPHLHNPAILNVPALALGQADEELRDLLDVVRFAAEQYFSDEPDPTISSEDLKNRLHMSELRIRKAITLLDAEPAILGGGSGPQTEGQYSWTRKVSDYVGHYKSVQTVEDYLVARREMYQPISSPVRVRAVDTISTTQDQQSTDGVGSRIRGMTLLAHEVNQIIDEMESWSDWVRVHDAEVWLDRLNSILAAFRLHVGEDGAPADFVLSDHEYSGTGKTITDSAFRRLKIAAKRLRDLMGSENLHVTSGSTAQLHDGIRRVSERLFLDGHPASAILEAFKAVNSRVKHMTNSPFDGKSLMAKVFDERDPLIKLSALETQSQRDEQEGFKFMYMGVMLGIRNPKAHDE